METLPRRLEALEDALKALPEESDAMTLGEIDGFIAGILVCPVEIPAEEWLGLLWRDLADDGKTQLVSDADAAALSRRILDHHRLTSLGLRAAEEEYAPVFYLEDETDDVIWEPWVTGFAEAMQVRMDSWGAITGTGDEKAIEAFNGMLSLARLAMRPDLKAPLSDADAELVAEAPDLLAVWTETLFDWRMAFRPDPVQRPVQVVKIGRNDPCPCGSGRKYKKCCGVNAAA